MARLVDVWTENQKVQKRHIPLFVDESLTMLAQFENKQLSCCENPQMLLQSVTGKRQKELERFKERFGQLSKEELATALTVSCSKVFSLLAQLVPCVGCRRSVERLYNDLVKWGYPGIEPLVLTSQGNLAIKRNYLFDARAVYALFYANGPRSANSVSCTKPRKGKRCGLHSLDSQKAKSTSDWYEIWHAMSKECRDEILIIESDALSDTINSYLRKHRFCTDCKTKVMRAFSILVDEVDGSKEKHYCPAMYEGLRCCRSDCCHIHVPSNEEYLSQLMARAEPEFQGTRRERHAKTLDIAQEEVLTCIGLYLYERLHKVWQRLREEEQTWQMLCTTGLDALRQCFELAVEKKQGISQLELLCLEFEEIDAQKEARREQRRQKKKKRRNKNKVDHNDNETMEPCVCEQHSVSASSSCSDHQVHSASRSDCGYSSGHECSESSHESHSADSSDIGCGDGRCSHHDDDECHPRSPKQSPKILCHCESSEPVKMLKCGQTSVELPGFGVNSLVQLLEEEDEGSCSAAPIISAEEIAQFRAREDFVVREREALRVKLWQSFKELQLRSSVACVNKS